ncbi:hypothetical protein SEA_WENTWORTH_63 [Streptomyces phage Wentworth]|nr:hypothetical protein SEA_WENTWORTH_63 [Streptomyces phage Wentworth]
MPKMKFGVGNNVSTDSGFTPYEGPLPKPGVIYPVVQKSATIRLTGENSKAPGTPYVNTMWEIESGDCKGYTVWHRLIPGEHEIQQTRIAQYMQAVTGKNMADIVHDDVEDGGKVKTVGGRKPEGVKAGMTFQRKKDTRNAIEGEETPWIAESADIIPGWKPKTKVEAEDESEPEDDVEDEIEDDEEDEAEDDDAEDDDAADDSDEEDSEEDDEDESEEDEEEDDAVAYEEAAKLSLIQLKKLAKENDYEDSDLTQYKGPKGKKALLAQLVEDEIVAAEGEDEPPF